MSRLNYRGPVIRLATVIALLLSITAVTPVLARDKCSIQTIAGRWMFATEVGQQRLIGDPLSGGPSAITAIGTMNIDRHGNVSGEFDVTIAGVVFVPDVTYSGPVTVNEDCTGTLSFTTASGATRTDSIVILSPDEMWGMSQDTLNLWTYRVRRISDQDD